MTEIVCWKAELDEQADIELRRAGAEWSRIEVPSYLKTLDEHGLLLELPPASAVGAAFCGFVNGLPVIGGLQRIRKGDLVRIVAADGGETSFVAGRIQASALPGNSLPCQFCGRQIDGEALRCPCGAVFCADIRRQQPTCPFCGEPFDVDSLATANDLDQQPPEELL